MPRIKEKKKEYIMWAEGGVVSFAELVDSYNKLVINPCVVTCTRTEEDYTDEDGLQRKRHMMHSEFFAYVYNAVYAQDNAPTWALAKNVTILEEGTKFHPSFIEMYHNYINSISIKRETKTK